MCLVYVIIYLIIILIIIIVIEQCPYFMETTFRLTSGCQVGSQ